MTSSFAGVKLNVAAVRISKVRSWKGVLWSGRRARRAHVSTVPDTPACTHGPQNTTTMMAAKGKVAKVASASVWVRPPPGEATPTLLSSLGPLRAGRARLSRPRLLAARWQPRSRVAPAGECAMGARTGGTASIWLLPDSAFRVCAVRRGPPQVAGPVLHRHPVLPDRRGASLSLPPRGATGRPLRGQCLVPAEAGSTRAATPATCRHSPARHAGRIDARACSRTGARCVRLPGGSVSLAVCHSCLLTLPPPPRTPSVPRRLRVGHRRPVRRPGDLRQVRARVGVAPRPHECGLQGPTAAPARALTPALYPGTARSS